MTNPSVAHSTWRRISNIPLPIKGPDGGPLRWQVPTVQVLSDRLWRIFLSARTKSNDIGSYFFDVQPHNAMRIVNAAPTLDFKDVPQGVFGHDGVGPSHFFNVGHTAYMALNAIRLTPPSFDATVEFWPAASGDGQFRFDPSIAPFQDGSFAASPFILKADGIYHMWYSRGTGWRMNAQPNPEPTYAIAHATSENGIDGWVIQNDLAIKPRNADETGITRANVQRRTDGSAGWEMWYSYRGKFDPERPTLRHYRIGYALSDDLISWERHDDLHRFVNPPKADDWDSDMQCYNTVVPFEGRQFMFYVGNDYGFGGVGYAERLTDPVASER